MPLKLIEEKEKAAAKEKHLAVARDRFIESAGKISANMLGMVSKVGGQIYALLFLARKPMSLDEIAQELKLPIFFQKILFLRRGYLAHDHPKTSRTGASANRYRQASQSFQP